MRSRDFDVQELSGIVMQALKPAQLVVELGAGHRVAVWKIEAADQQTAYGSLDVAAVAVVRVSRQASARKHRQNVSRKDCHAIPALLAVPDGAIA